MATMIIKQLDTWTPVEINIKFETREQLAAFVEVCGAAMMIGRALENNGGYATTVAERMDAHGFTKAISDSIQFDVWKELAELADK